MLITLLILSTAFIELKITKDSSEQMLEITSKTERSAKDRSDNTKQLCMEMKDTWQKYKSKLGFFMTHSEIDQIDISIENINRYCDQGNYAEVYVECGELKNRTAALGDGEKISFYNLF